MPDEIAPLKVKQMLQNWNDLYERAMGDELGFLLALQPDRDWDDHLNYFANFAHELGRLAQNMQAEIEEVDERIAKFLVELEEYDREELD